MPLWLEYRVIGELMKLKSLGSVSEGAVHLGAEDQRALANDPENYIKVQTKAWSHLADDGDGDVDPSLDDAGNKLDYTFGRRGKLLMAKQTKNQIKTRTK